MTTVEFSEHVGPAKILHLNVPVDEADRTYRVTVLIQPQFADSGTDHADWPQGFIESTAGAWQGDFPDNIAPDDEPAFDGGLPNDHR